MRTFKTIACIALGLTFVLSSCSVEKRVHMSGYHIEWHKGKGKPAQVAQEAVEQPASVGSDNTAAHAEEQAPDVAAPMAVVTDENTITASGDGRIGVEDRQTSARERLARDHARTSAQVDDSGNGTYKGLSGPLRDASKVITKAESFQKKMSSKRGGGGSKWLWIWIGCFVLATILLVLYVATLGSIAFYIGAVLAYIAGCVFATIWIIDLFS